MVVDVELFVLKIFKILPTFKLPPIPTPPTTCNAPVLVDVDTALLDNINVAVFKLNVLTYNVLPT